MDQIRIDPRRLLPSRKTMERNPKVIICSSHHFLPKMALPHPETAISEMIIYGDNKFKNSRVI